MTCATSFKQFIKFNKDEQSKNTELIRLTYKRQKTLRKVLTNKNSFIKNEIIKPLNVGNELSVGILEVIINVWWIIIKQHKI